MTPSSPGLHWLGLLLPSEWLPLVWGGEAPQFADESEAKAVLGAIMARHNEILRQIADDDTRPPSRGSQRVPARAKPCCFAV